MIDLKSFSQKHLSSGAILKGFSIFKKQQKEEDQHLDRARLLAKRKIESALRPRTGSMLKFYLSKAGFDSNHSKIALLVFRLVVIMNLAISAYLIFRFSTDLAVSPLYVTVIMLVLWVFAFVGLLFAMWFMVFIVLDLRIFKRRVDIEEVLPDYLQLTSANIRSGMPLDRALWYAVRPRFGVLAKEIEIVAKETMSGEELETALKKFTDKYDSVVLKRAINLLIESYNAGGEIGDILNKISENIKENQLMKKEMSANVTTYAIFITFATIIAAPLLFALSGQFLKIINKILTTINFKEIEEAGVGFSFSFSSTGVSQSDFMVFSIVSLAISSCFSAAIVATIKKGSIRGGITYFPVFMGVSILLFLVMSVVFSYALADLL